MDQRVLGDVGEFGLLADLLPRFPQGVGVVVGPGDDAAVLAVSAGAASSRSTTAGGQIVASLDVLVEGRDFRRDWSSANDVGHRAAAANLSDVNAMGGRGTALLVGLAAPSDLPVQWVLDLADGIAEECVVVGANVVGGDLSGSAEIVVSVAVLGRCEDRVVRRSGAQPGDVVAVAGRLGWAEAGRAVLTRGFRSPRAVVDAHRRPQPPYDAGPGAARAGATAMIDVSDGLLADLGHLADASQIALDVSRGRFEIPEALQTVAAAIGADPLSFVLSGGDDLALAATFPAAVELPDGWRAVGAVTTDGAGGLVTVDGEVPRMPTGHQHFR